MEFKINTIDGKEILPIEGNVQFTKQEDAILYLIKNAAKLRQRYGVDGFTAIIECIGYVPLFVNVDKTNGVVFCYENSFKS